MFSRACFGAAVLLAALGSPGEAQTERPPREPSAKEELARAIFAPPAPEVDPEELAARHAELRRQVAEQLIKADVTVEELLAMGEKLGLSATLLKEVTDEVDLIRQELEASKPDQDLEALLEHLFQSVRGSHQVDRTSGKPVLQARALQVWGQYLDLDGNLGVSFVELRDRSHASLALFRRLDLDSSGEVSFEELALPLAGTARKMGAVIPEELEEWLAKTASELHVAADGDVLPQELQVTEAELVLARAKFHLYGVYEDPYASIREKLGSAQEATGLAMAGGPQVFLVTPADATRIAHELYPIEARVGAPAETGWGDDVRSPPVTPASPAASEGEEQVGLETNSAEVEAEPGKSQGETPGETPSPVPVGGEATESPEPKR